MKKTFLTPILLLTVFSAIADEWKPGQWPMLKHYDQNHLFQIALPLGGIGTGQVSLGGRGELRDWEIMNIPAKGFSTVYTGSSNAPFFAIYAKPDGQQAVTTLLEGRELFRTKPTDGLLVYGCPSCGRRDGKGNEG